MRVRCLKILEGGRRLGREIEDSRSINVGSEYVVLAIACLPMEGASYLLLRDGGGLQYAWWPAEMFSLSSGDIPSSWAVNDPHGRGILVEIMPRAWHRPDFWERLADDAAVREQFRTDVAQMYAKEGMELPTGS
jgi:hypothetical protein